MSVAAPNPATLLRATGTSPACPRRYVPRQQFDGFAPASPPTNWSFHQIREAARDVSGTSIGCSGLGSAGATTSVNSPRGDVKCLQMLRNWSNNQFFVHLGELAANGNHPVAEDLQQIGRACAGSGAALRRTRSVEARRRATSSQRFLALALDGGKPTNRNCVGRQPGRRDGGHGRAEAPEPARPGSRRRAPRRPACAPGSETTGVPASDTSATESPRVQPGDERRRSRSLVVFVQARRRRRDRVVLEEPRGPAGVFCGDERHFPQHAKRPERDVLQVADRCGDHIEDAGHACDGLILLQCIQPNPCRTSSTNTSRICTRSTPPTPPSTASICTTTCSRT